MSLEVIRERLGLACRWTVSHDAQQDPFESKRDLDGFCDLGNL